MLKFKHYLTEIANQNAEETYKQRSKDISNLLKDIQKKLSVHEARFKKDNDNWGYVGSLGAVKEKLSDINDFLGK
jgi:predicted metal-dependent hydrolase